jgi:hypothetical protein
VTPLSSLRAAVFAPAFLGFLLLLPPVLWSQVDLNTQEGDSGPEDTAPLQAPPPVNGNAYATGFTSETESNYLRCGLTIGGAYSNNITGGGTSNPNGGGSLSLWPTIVLDKNTSRGRYLLNYSPGFTFYPRASGLNQGSQIVGAALQYRLSPNLTVNVQDSFLKSSNIFNQPNPLSSTVISGSAPVPVQAVVPPVGDQLSNSANAQLTYQLDESSMVGAGGTFASLQFSNSGKALNPSDSNSAAGSAFYSRRLRDKFSVGANYQFQVLDTSQSGIQSINNTRTQTQTIFLFLSIFLNPTLSVSLSAGPQHITTSQGPFSAVASWSPLTMASISWQGSRTSLAVSYSRIVTAAGGLNGAYHSNNASASARWQMARTWSGGIGGSYALYQTVNPLIVLASSGGHTVTGTVSIDHVIGEHLRSTVGYSWVRQSYSQTMTESNFPNISRGFITISYTFSRPLQ